MTDNKNNTHTHKRKNKKNNKFNKIKNNLMQKDTIKTGVTLLKESKTLNKGIGLLKSTALGLFDLVCTAGKEVIDTVNDFSENKKKKN